MLFYLSWEPETLATQNFHHSVTWLQMTAKAPTALIWECKQIHQYRNNEQRRLYLTKTEKSKHIGAGLL